MSTGNIGTVCDAPPNSAMQGFAVRLSSYVTQMCLAILIKWSPPEHRLYKLAHIFLLQSYTIILSTYLTVGRQQLSISDVKFAVFLIMISPIGLYYFVSNVRDLWRNWRRVFTRRDIVKLPRRVLLLILPGLVFILLVIAYFPTSFSDSSCPVVSKNNNNITTADKIAFYPSFAGFLIWGVFYLVYTLRHLKDIFVEARTHAKSKNHNSSVWFDWVKFAIRFPRSWMVWHWRVVYRSHPWLLSIAIICGYAFWADLIKPFTMESGYEFSYGQLLALFTMVEPLLGTLILIYDRRKDLWHFIIRRPRSIHDGWTFIFTGRGDPWKGSSVYESVDNPLDEPSLKNPSKYSIDNPYNEPHPASTIPMSDLENAEPPSSDSTSVFDPPDRSESPEETHMLHDEETVLEPTLDRVIQHPRSF